jgi:hypothetical protein
MKKLYTTSFLLLFSIFATAQVAQAPEEASDCVNTTTAPTAVQQSSADRGGPLWSEDFSQGFPAAWTLTDNSGICPWKWTMNGTHGYFNGNQATTYDAPINSTTAANGFLICDVDSANQFTYGQPSSTNYQYLDTWFTTDAIDLTGEPSVKLEFEHAFRFNNTVDLTVSVSNDNVSWTDWTVQGTAQNNAASADPEYASINISAVAGNQPTVYIRIGWNARVYFWMIDDMAIVPAPDDDISMSWTQFDNYIEYYQYPIRHVQQLDFRAEAANEGANQQTNVALNVDVLDAGQALAFNGTSTPVTFAPLFTDTLSTTASFTPSVIDDYTMHYTITQDATDLFPMNDSVAIPFAVTDTVYARDNGNYATQWSNGDDGGTPPVSNPFLYGNQFEIQTNDNATSVSIRIAGNTDAGALVYGAIYHNNNGTFDYIDQTNDYTVTANDIGGFITIPFSFPVAMTAGEQYIVLAGHYGGPDEVWIGRAENSSPPQTAFLLDGTDNTWYYTTRSPMVRLNVESMFISVEENAFIVGDLQTVPNPATNQTTVIYTMKDAADINIDVLDVTGKIVFTDRLGIQPEGENRYALNTSQLAAGMYTIRLLSNGQSSTSKLMITK